MNQKGQAVIILLMIMLVTLTVGLAITQHSLTDLSTSTKVEESSRAFGAAEAGIERALANPIPNQNVSFSDNQSNASVSVVNGLPQDHQALEYPPISKQDFAQFWLANPTDLSNPYPANVPLNIYFGSYISGESPTDPNTAAIEVDLISRDSLGNFSTNRSYFDPVSNRSSQNNFTPAVCPAGEYITDTSSGVGRSFRCVVSLTPTQSPILLRLRILYSNTAQAIAVAPTNNQSLPKQAIIITSVGSAGGTQKKIQVFKLPNVVPAFFDYSIFSVGDLIKPTQ